MFMKKPSKLFLFAGDQKIEHLNCVSPEHLFSIASKARIGAFTTHLGLISKYGANYKNIEYIVKLNGKTNLVPTAQKDPLSLLLHTIEEVVQVKKELKLPIIGVGYTVYLGSEFEAHMLSQAAQIVYEAQQNDLLSILWMYPRGKAVKDERNADLIAGAAGVGASLGADFVKVNPPEINGSKDAELLKMAVASVGKTGLICSGGEKIDTNILLQRIYDQINTGGACGAAVGRNIFEREESEAIELCNEIAEIIYDGKKIN